MPSKTKKSNQFTINITSLTVKKSEIDYGLLRQHLRIYVYDLSESRIYSLAIPNTIRYQKMYSSLRKQTVMADGSQYAFEFYKSRQRVYICLPIDKPPFEIEDFEGERYQPQEFFPDLDDNLDIADLFRLVCKVYCVKDEIDMSFVGQGPMYFPTGQVYNYQVEVEEPGPRKPEGRPVLGVYPRHNWKRERQLAGNNGSKQDTLEFLMPDMLRQMYLVYKTTALTKENLAWKSYYKLASGGKAFVPLIPRDIDNLSQCVVYRLQGENRPSGKKSGPDDLPSQTSEREKGSLPPKKRKSINFFDPTKPEKLKQSRCHVLLSTYRKLSQYLTKIGLPTELTRIQVKKVTLQKKASFPLSKYPVTLINGLWQENGGAGSQRQQERFEKMVAIIQKILAKEKITVEVKGREALENPLPDERFLILIDYSKKAFEEGGPLAGLPDPYQDDLPYKKKDVVLKHLNINSNDNLTSEDDAERDLDDQIPGENSDSGGSDLEETRLHMSKSKYLSYELPIDKQLENRLWISLYNLHIIDLLYHSQGIWQRMPLLEGDSPKNMYTVLEGVFFIHRRNVLFCKENRLCFQKVSDRVFKEDLKQLTDRDYKDILSQMERYHIWNVQKKESLENSYVMVSKEYLLEISKGDNCRALFDTGMVLDRIEQRQKGRPLDEFKVSNLDQIPSAWRDVFNQWNEFVDVLSRKKDVEDLVSFEKLTKDSAKGGYNGYQVIPRKNPTKVSEFNDILSNAIGIDLRTPTNGMDYGKGIWFDKEAMKYMVGGGLAINGKKAMVRSNLVRDIILLDGQFNPDKFFPLLNVDFVRKEGYPVLPFPFKILKDAMELEEVTAR